MENGCTVFPGRLAGHWIVVQIAARREHHVRLWLMRARFETYYPLIRYRHRVTGLYPTYLFVRLVGGQFYPIAKTPHVIRIIMSGDRPAPLPDSVVTDLKRRERDGYVRLPRAPRLRPGQEVRIVGGSFEGRLGLYQGQSGRDRERVLLEFLGRQVSVDLPARDLATATPKILRVRQS